MPARVLAASLLVFASCAEQGGATSAAGAERAEVPVVRITARRWAYEPAEIELALGAPVILELISEDVHHGFNLAELKLRADVVPDHVTRIELTPDRSGTFLFYCDYYCGAGHEEMTGQIVVK